MTRYIGMDVHSSTCTVVTVGDNGRKLKSDVMETNGQILIEYLNTIPRPRHLCFEEGTQSGWLHEILSPHVDELVVSGIEMSRGPKNDACDALQLAQALRLGAIKTPVFKAPGQFAALRQLACTYDQITRDVVRTQCRIKNHFRARGVSATGRTVYSPAHRDEWLGKLPVSHRDSALLLCTQYDHLVELKKQAEKQLVHESHRCPVSRIIETCPGFGPIRTAETIPVIVTPHRFRTARQLCSYAGLGIVMRSSADWVKQDGQFVRAQVNKTRGLNRRFNHTLKKVFKGAATTVITKLPDSALCAYYRRQLDNGTKPNLAKLSVARKIAAILLAMWKAQEEYDPARHQPK